MVSSQAEKLTITFRLVHACDVPVAVALLTFHCLDRVLKRYNIKAPAFAYLVIKNKEYEEVGV